MHSIVGHCDEGDYGRMFTVLQIRPVDDGVDVIFAESARFYHLFRANPKYEQLRRTLSAGIGQQLRVRFTAPNSDVIEAVCPQP
jgi:hypothetical protein